MQIIKESRDISKGIFLIPNRQDPNYCFTIQCDLDGMPFSYDGLNAKSGTTYNHEKLWKTLPPKMTHNKQFNYYPRGRVEIANNKAVVYLNPKINTEEVQEFIIDQFYLHDLKVRFVADGSGHYRSHLD